jgi:hypothetical protein
MRQPGFGRPPIAKDRRFGYIQQSRGFADVKAPKKPAFNHGGLARLNPGKLIQSSVERQ